MGQREKRHEHSDCRATLRGGEEEKVVLNEQVFRLVTKQKQSSPIGNVSLVICLSFLYRIQIFVVEEEKESERHHRELQ